MENQLYFFMVALAAESLIITADILIQKNGEYFYLIKEVVEKVLPLLN